jgi:hypothetical protein
LWPGSKGVAREKHRPRHFGLRISDFLVFFFNPHSAIYNPQFSEAGPPGATEFGIRNVEFGILLFFLIIPHSAFYIPHFCYPPDPRNETRLMIFSRNALASGPGNA